MNPVRAIVLAALACMAAPTAAHAVAPSFAPPQSYGRGVDVGNMALGDIDGANGPDLAYTSEVGGLGSRNYVVQVSRNNGDGTFGAPTRYPTAPTGARDIPLAIGLGRFDRGPTADLMIAGSIGVTVRPGNGDGTFGELRASGLPGEDLAVDDLNGDGVQDAVVAQARERNLAVLTARGNGLLDLARLPTGDGRHWPRGIAVADLNGDARPDIVAADDDETVFGSYVGGVTLFVNGPGGFVRRYLPYALGSTEDVAVADFDEDGIPDIAVSNATWYDSSRVSVLRGTGGASFAAPVHLPAPGAEGLVIADFNADGHRDIAAGSLGTRFISVLAGRGDGGFEAPLALSVGDAYHPAELAAADVNRDGAFDLVSGNLGSPGVSVFINTIPNPGARPLRSRPALVRSSTRWLLRDSLSGGSATTAFNFGTVPQHTIMGDWNGDGTQTPGTYAGGTFRLRNTNSNGPADMTFRFGDQAGYPVSGDFDGDGRDDVAVYRGSAWQVRLSSGQTSRFTFGAGSWPATVPVAGDWDGDGRDGVGTYTTATATWRLRATATAGPTSARFDFGTPGSSYPVAGDWNADARDTIGVKTGAGWKLRDANGSGPADIAFTYGSAADHPLGWRTR